MISSQAANSTPNSIPRDTTDKVILLDGRIIEISIGMLHNINDKDGNQHILKLDTLEGGNALHESIYTCIKITLSTHSITYNRTILYAVK